MVTMGSDLSAGGETEVITKNNVCVNKISADDATLSESRKETIDKAVRANCTPKAKRSLKFDEERHEPRKSKRNELRLIRIKLPIVTE